MYSASDRSIDPDRMYRMRDFPFASLVLLSRSPLFDCVPMGGEWDGRWSGVQQCGA